jgi:hypothetical protein
MPREDALFSFDRGTRPNRPTLPTGESFYTNISKSGYQPDDGGDRVTVDQYVEGLKEQFPSVVVVPTAIDSNGRPVENCVAIFVKKNPVKIGKKSST